MQQSTNEEKMKQEIEDAIEERFPNPTTKFSIGKIDAMFKQPERIQLVKQKEKENQLMHNYFQQIWKTQEVITKDVVSMKHFEKD